MDELKNLRRMMKNETFSNHGFTTKMRNNIVNEINSEKVVSTSRKLPFPQALSFVFIAACLSLFTYFGGTQLGLMDGGNSASSGDFKNEISQAALGWPVNFGYPVKVPFEVAEIHPLKEYSFGDVRTPFYRLVITGVQDQEMIIEYSPGVQMVDQTDESLPEGVRETSVEIEAVKINGAIGNYHETTYESFLNWQDGDTAVTISYEKGSSEKMAGKEELTRVAQSFQHRQQR
ncbi:hypothetical protein [Bacillus sp. AK031]